MTLVSSAYANGSDQTLQEAEQLLCEADMFYWVSLSDGGNLSLLLEGRDRLDEAVSLLHSIEEDCPEAGVMLDEALALLVEINEQIIMAHDTINGTLPLLKYFIGDDPITEWYDDPEVVAAVQGANQIVQILEEGHWGYIPQLDVIFHSRIETFQEDQDSQISGEALENEIAYIINRSPRFFIHHRAEMASALSDPEFERFQSEGLDGAMAFSALDAWGITRLLEIQLSEVNTEDRYWFYTLQGRLFSVFSQEAGSSVSVYSIVRDNRDKMLLVALFNLTALFVSMMIAFFAGWKWNRVLPGYLTGFLGYLVFRMILARQLPPGDDLLISNWWWIALMGLYFCIVVPCVVFLLSKRVPKLGSWLFSTSASSMGISLGFSAAYAGLISWSALTLFNWPEAVALTLIAALSFPFGISACISIIRTGDRQAARQSFIAAGTIVTASIIALISSVSAIDRSVALLLFGLIIVGFSIASVVGFCRSNAISAMFLVSCLYSCTVFFLLLSGRIEFALVLPVPFILQVTATRKNRRERFIGSSSASLQTVESEDVSWERILSGNETEWPFWRGMNAFRELTRKYDSAMDDSSRGVPEVLYVGGTAGSGKTRAIIELTKERDAILITGECEEGDSYSFLYNILTDNSDISSSTGSHELSAIGGRLLSLLPGVGSVLDYLDNDSDSSVMLSPGEIASSILDVLVSIRDGEIPIVFWIDRVESLDSDGQAVLSSLLENAASREIGFVLLLSGRASPERILPLSPVCRCSSIEFNWSKAEDIAFLQECLAFTSLNPFLSKIENAGNPIPVGFFVNWLRHLWQQGSLEIVDSVLAVRRDVVPEGIEVPLDILESAGNVLHEFSMQTNKILQMAACDGEKFNVHKIAEALGMPVYEILYLLSEAEAKGVITDIPEDGEFKFNSSMVYDYINRSFLVNTDQHSQLYHTIHRDLAEVYRTETDKQSIIKAAFHSRKAGEHYHKDALEFSLTGCEVSLSLGQWRGAQEAASFVIHSRVASEAQIVVAGIAYFRSLWNLKEQPDMEVFTTLLSSCDKALRAGTLESYDEYALLACELTRLGWPSSWRHIELQCPVELLDLIDTAALNGPTKIHVLHYKACSIEKMNPDHNDLSAITEALKFCGKALEVDDSSAEALQRKAEVMNTKAEILIKSKSNDREEIVELIQESIRLKEDSGDLLGSAISYGTLGRFYYYGKDPSEECYRKAMEAFTRDLELSEKTGDVLGQVVMPSSIAWCLFNLARYDDALSSFRLSLKRSAALRQYTNQVIARLGIIRTLLRLESEDDLLEECRKLMQMSGSPEGRDKTYVNFLWQELLNDSKGSPLHIREALVGICPVGIECSEK